MSFQIHALPKETFAPLFPLSAEQLKPHHAVRMTATKKPGYPCRVSLSDAEPGEEVLLVHYLHHDVEGPFRASHAVYVRPHATQAAPAPGEVPHMFRGRTLSLRAFDTQGMMIHADLAQGTHLEAAIQAIFEDPAAAAIHLHFAKPGCFAARVTR